ncbi:hypothetical protein HS1genome_1476 [Sulfodiicoccus acidiphilus]|uniref:Uncharacterized protein n=1 Tax=Sulfodiicoccus acidiphilus TaxID=1670455 RepID=A0A348B4I5_9CREN|nr:hypothetical protein [Sulfodiicoccus acidiphilus]BBD73087.1 hypothetical protein HS1genome_1476 [Sulfodiicoccus acidiphilus]GGU05221.1 hypothetical protein GCM10007116_22130 [Sulfodiicoccus acidiphilus]
MSVVDTKDAPPQLYWGSKGSRDNQNLLTSLQLNYSSAKKYPLYSDEDCHLSHLTAPQEM